MRDNVIVCVFDVTMCGPDITWKSLLLFHLFTDTIELKKHRYVAKHTRNACAKYWVNTLYNFLLIINIVTQVNDMWDNVTIMTSLTLLSALCFLKHYPCSNPSQVRYWWLTVMVKTLHDCWIFLECRIQLNVFLALKLTAH